MRVRDPMGGRQPDNLIMTLTIRGVGTGELVIPADRIGPDDLKAYGAILECLEGVKS